MSQSAFRVFEPAASASSVIFASPHSGRNYSDSFVAKSQLDELALRSSEDAFVDLLCRPAPNRGATFIAAEFPRAYVDLNRDCNELDPALIKSLPRGAINPRVAAGLGVIPRVVGGRRAIYRDKIEMAEVNARLDQCWYPYHRRLRALIEKQHLQTGLSILVDCHSMPSQAIAERANTAKPNIIIGDLFGRSAARYISNRIENLFKDEGFITARNTPFAGAYILRQYGQPTQNRHAIQVEIDRSLYMNEDSLELHDGFFDLRRKLKNIMHKIVELGQQSNRIAAE